MPYRKTTFIDGGIYHVLNRAISNTSILTQKNDCQRFIDLVKFLKFNPKIKFSRYKRLVLNGTQDIVPHQVWNEPVVDILALSLMPNHFHLLIRQLKKNGVQDFMRNLQNSYAKYYNIKSKRVGPLFQSAFKAVDIRTDEQFIHVSRYIHLNPVSSKLIEVKELENYPWTSFQYYMDSDNDELIDTRTILNIFKTNEEYKRFVLDHAGYQKKLQDIKHLVLEQ